ncbi:MAG: hypothetical protein OXM57_06095 [bacterium]|nr:hypothetical protein [bacterium]
MEARSVLRAPLVDARHAVVQHTQVPMVRHVLVDAAWLDRLGLPGGPADGLGQTGRFHARRLPRATSSAMANGCRAPLVLLR